MYVNLASLTDSLYLYLPINDLYKLILKSHDTKKVLQKQGNPWFPSRKKDRQNTGLYWVVSRFVKLYENVI